MRDCEQMNLRMKQVIARHYQRVLIGILVSVFALIADAAWAETVAEHFDRQMKAFAASCAKKKPRPGDVTCDRLKLKPADPLATEEGRFAHSIQIPNPVPEDSGYKPGMTSEEYFNHLCKTEAGEFIFKTVENVEGLYMMRPRKHATDFELEDLYALEDPYGYVDGEATGAEFLFVDPKRYKFFEMSTETNRKLRWGQKSLHPSYFFKSDADTKYERYFGYNARDINTMIKEHTDVLKSRYGYTWRGITRPHDRELGIAGGELIVLDLQTDEVLAVRRGYIRSGWMRNLTGIWWLTGHVCPKYGLRGGRDKDFDFGYWFIGKVLRPFNFEESFKELTNGK